MQNRGFTIVELLIVIVVIGILAAITVVAFNGIQSRAENTKTITSVAAYTKALNLYRTENGTFPQHFYSCLGPIGTTCSNVTDSVGACPGSGGAQAQSVFDAAMKAVAGSLPAPSTQRMTCDGKQFSGAWFNSPGSTGVNAEITYFLKGDQPCDQVGGLTFISRYRNGDATACYMRVTI